MVPFTLSLVQATNPKKGTHILTMVPGVPRLRVGRIGFDLRVSDPRCQPRGATTVVRAYPRETFGEGGGGGVG